MAQVYLGHRDSLMRAAAFEVWAQQLLLDILWELVVPWASILRTKKMGIMIIIFLMYLWAAIVWLGHPNLRTKRWES